MIFYRVLKLLPLEFRHQIFSTVAVFLFIIALCPGVVSASTRFGLWVEAEGVNQPFRSYADYQSFRESVEGSPYTDLYCQVYRRGRAWFPSIVADDSPYRDALTAGIDPLRDTIKFAHSRNKKVHAWVNTLRIKGNIDAPIFKVVGRNAALVDNRGFSLLEYDDEGRPPVHVGGQFQLDTPGIWLDPSVKQVREYLKEVVRDLVMSYPDLDGVHLDMIRFPYAVRVDKGDSSLPPPGFGYSSESQSQRFLTSTLDDDLRNRINPALNVWDELRMAHVTLLVLEIRELLDEIAPDMELSAAVLGDAVGAGQRAFQDWPRWLEIGIVDSVLPMIYTKDMALLDRRSRYAVSVGAQKNVIIGLGAWLMLDRHERLLEQAKRAMQLNAHGIVLFSYSNLHSSSGAELTKKVAEIIGIGL